MQQSEKIRESQFTILVTLFTIGTSILLVPGIVTIYAKQDGWLSSVLALLLSLPLIFMYNKLASAFQGGDFFTYINSILSKWLGKIIVLSFIIYNIILFALLIRQVAHFAVTQSFPETPMGVIIALFMLIVITGSRYGIETLARSGEILIPWVFIIFLILLVTLIPELKTEQLFPILEKGLKPVLLGTYAQLSLPYLELFLFLFIIPYSNDPQKTGKAFYKGVILGGIVIILITLYTILVLGYEAVARNEFPSYSMSKTISIANTIERIEAILAAIWFITIYMKITLIFYCTTLCIAHLFNVKDKKVLMYPLGLILLFLTLYISPNIAHFNEFIMKIWPLYSMTLGMLIPLLLIAIATVKRRQKRRGENA